MESTWSPPGVHGVHKIITKIGNIRWTPHGVHLESMELCGICGVHLESMGECKVHTDTATRARICTYSYLCFLDLHVYIVHRIYAIHILSCPRFRLKTFSVSQVEDSYYYYI
jgi:hypothetical protein